jgi:AcrR family transcriptional regulator
MSSVTRVRSNGAVPAQAESGLDGLAKQRVEGIQRARVLAAMVEICSEQGLADATVSRIVSRAGVSRRTYYELFENREDCFIVALDGAVARASACVLPAYESGSGWAEQLRMALTALLCFLDAEHGLGELLILSSAAAGPQAIQRRQHVFAEMIAAVDLGRSERKTAGPPSLTAEGIVGAVFSILQARMLAGERPLVGFVNSLMALIVLPYRGPAAARTELEKPMPLASREDDIGKPNPLRDLGMRLTYRTVRVLLAVAAHPGASNRAVADVAGITDPGQISKLLMRLQGLGLLKNAGADCARGEPNEWVLTTRGQEVHDAIDR